MFSPRVAFTLAVNREKRACWCSSESFQKLMGTEACEIIGSCNVAGFTKEKLGFFRDILSPFDIVCLQETHGVAKDSRFRTLKLGFEKGVFSLHKRASRGSAIIWKSSVKQIGEPWTDSEGRIAAVVLKKDEGPNTLVVSVYAPNLSPSKEAQSAYVSFLITLEYAISRMLDTEKVDNIFLMGDFNLICDSELDSLSASPTLYKVTEEALTEVLRKFDLFDVFRSLFPEETAFTYSRRGIMDRHGVRGPPVMNRLDYAFTRAETLEKVKKFEHRPTAMTDHKMVVVDCSAAAPEERRRLGLWKHNDRLNHNTEFVKDLSSKLEDFIPKAQQECSNARGAWEAIKGKIRE